MVRRVVRESTVHRLIVPVLCGSALDYIGIQPLLRAISELAPAPDELGPTKGHPSPDSDEEGAAGKPKYKDSFKVSVGKPIKIKGTDLNDVLNQVTGGGNGGGGNSAFLTLVRLQ